MDVRALLWLFPAVVTLHNAEEAIWLPTWSERAGRWYKPVAAEVFRFAASILTAVAYILTWLAVRSGRQSLWEYLVLGYMVAMIVNAFIPHLALTVASRRYMPGLATGLFLNVPVLGFLIDRLYRQGDVSGAKAALACVVVPLLLLLSIPGLFRLGKAVMRRRRMGFLRIG